MRHYSKIFPLFSLLLLPLGAASGADQPPYPDAYNSSPQLTDDNYIPPQNMQAESPYQCWFCKYMGSVRTPGTPETISWEFMGIPFLFAMLFNSGDQGES